MKNRHLLSTLALVPFFALPACDKTPKGQKSNTPPGSTIDQNTNGSSVSSQEAEALPEYTRNYQSPPPRKDLTEQEQKEIRESLTRRQGKLPTSQP